MKYNNIDILCIQETWTKKADVYVEHGFEVILSGSELEGRTFTGVGFILAPHVRRRIRSYKQISDRVAVINVSVEGGVVAIFSAYAPHNLRPLDEKLEFYRNLDNAYNTCAVNLGKIILGDLNARVGKQACDEEHIVGPYGFGRPALQRDDVSNRELLLEFCASCGLLVANTFMPGAEDEKVTYMNPGTKPADAVTDSSFGMIDFLLCEPGMFQAVRRLHTVWKAVLRSDHFLVRVVLELHVPAAQEPSKARKDRSALLESGYRQEFAQTFHQGIVQNSAESATLSERWVVAQMAMKNAEEILPSPVRKANRAWISEETLDLIDQRTAARLKQDSALELSLHKEIRKKAKEDRTNWLDKLLAEGRWSAIKNLRKGRLVRQGRLRDASGDLVDSSMWAETMAKHLEHVQWAVRPVQAVDGPPLGAPLDVNMEAFTEEEVRETGKKLRKGRASGPDDIPAEYWQAVVEDSANLRWLIDFCSQCLKDARVPEAWQLSHVAAIYKKGSVGSCDNYRPISLLSVGYKLFAALLLRRLQTAGAEELLCDSQFGFRRKRGTSDAIFAVRRHIETALAHRTGASFIALDWAKAFDSIMPEPLQTALLRFGLPERLVRLISNIYAQRAFKVVSGQTESTQHRQAAGISQGCPLSPFLFIMVMSVIMYDTVAELTEDSKRLMHEGRLATVLYADDTLLIGPSERSLKELLGLVAQKGQAYGLCLHWHKFQVLNVRNSCHFTAPTGDLMPESEWMVYLGAALHNDGSVRNELTRKFGRAWAEFTKLVRLWKHTSLSLRRKIEIFQAVVTSQVMYGLTSAWLTKADQRRLNGFQARCLRVLIRVAPSYISRISNKIVLGRTEQLPYTTQLMKQQLLLFGRIARAGDADVLRQLAFIPGMLEPTANRYVRRVGRPKQEWVTMLKGEALKFTRSAAELESAIQDAPTWERAVQSYCAESLR